MRSRLALALLAVAALLTLAACGASDTASSLGPGAAASVVPADVVAFIDVSSELESAQWQQVQTLAERFPGKDKAVRQILDSLGEQDLDWKTDVEPALGPETAIAVIRVGSETQVVGLTKPDDKAKLDALLAKSDEPSEQRQVDGWTAIADTAAVLDAYETALKAGSLDGAKAYQDATDGLPADAIGTFYVGPGAADAASGVLGSLGPAAAANGKLEWLGGALRAQDNGLLLTGSAKSTGGPKAAAYEPAYLSEIPADAIAVISFHGTDDLISQFRKAGGSEFVPMIESALGVTLDDLAPLFAGEGALYVRQGTPIPEVTIVLGVADEASALTTLDQLAGKAAALVGGKTGTTKVDGINAKYIDIQGVRVSYAAFDGKLVLTSGPFGIRELRDGGDSIADDSAFKDAAGAAGYEGSTAGLVYVSLEDVLPLADSLAGLGGQPLPDEVRANLEPLRSFFLQGDADGDLTRFSAFLGVA